MINLYGFDIRWSGWVIKRRTFVIESDSFVMSLKSPESQRFEMHQQFTIFKSRHQKGRYCCFSLWLAGLLDPAPCWVDHVANASPCALMKRINFDQNDIAGSSRLSSLRRYTSALPKIDRNSHLFLIFGCQGMRGKWEVIVIPRRRGTNAQASCVMKRSGLLRASMGSRIEINALDLRLAQVTLPRASSSERFTKQAGFAFTLPPHVWPGHELSKPLSTAVVIDFISVSWFHSNGCSVAEICVECLRICSCTRLVARRSLVLKCRHLPKWSCLQRLNWSRTIEINSSWTCGYGRPSHFLSSARKSLRKWLTWRLVCKFCGTILEAPQYGCEEDRSANQGERNCASIGAKMTIVAIKGILQASWRRIERVKKCISENIIIPEPRTRPDRKN